MRFPLSFQNNSLNKRKLIRQFSFYCINIVLLLYFLLLTNFHFREKKNGRDTDHQINFHIRTFSTLELLNLIAYFHMTLQFNKGKDVQVYSIIR